MIGKLITPQEGEVSPLFLQLVVDSLAKSLDSQERTSDPVNKKLAEVANVCWLKKLGDDQYKETTGKYFRPENCKKVVVPKVNEEIWVKLSRNAKSRDVKFSRLKSNVTKAGCVVLNTAESLLNLSAKADKSLAGEPHNLLVQATDAIQLLGHASFEIAQLRREDIKPQLNREYGDLCSANVPVTEWLFGDDLQTKLTHIRTANRVGSTAIQAHGFHRRGNRAGSKAPAIRAAKPALVEQPRQVVSRETTTRPNTAEIETQPIFMLQTIQVTEYESLLPSLVEVYRLEADNSQAGQLPYFVNEWRALTSDTEILETVTGQHIEFNETPVQINPPFQPCWGEKEACIIDTEISDLLSKGVITESVHECDEFISTIFLRPKKDGTHRVILNLKSLKQYVTYYHFKMDTIHTAVEMMTPGCYMCSVDLKSAYYSVAIAPSDQKYLKFSWRGKLYQFTCFPNGLAFCQRKFTKLLKPVYSTLRNLGHLSVAYIDDSYLQADTYELCVRNVIDTLSLFHQLGFVIHPDKSVLIPTQSLTFLGFVLDSQSMTVALTGEQAVKVKEACQQLLQEKAITIREVAKVLGLLTSSLPGVLYGPLHYKSLEMDKTQALKSNQGNFDSIMALSGEAVADLKWWINSVEETYKPVKQRETQITMTTDASKKGWGCSVEGTSTGGSWTQHEAQYHINYLETKAVFLALQAFSHEVSGKCVCILVDNTTACVMYQSNGNLPLQRNQ